MINFCKVYFQNLRTAGRVMVVIALAGLGMLLGWGQLAGPSALAAGSSTPLPPVTAATATPPHPSTPTATPPPLTATATLTPAGQLTLLRPLLPKDGCSGDQDIHFEWQWSGPFDPLQQGFELRVWREGEPPLGAHDAALDNKNGRVKALPQNIYSLDLNISGAAGVRYRSGDYWWTILLVKIAPTYQEIGIQASPGLLCLAVSNHKKGGGRDSGGGGDGGGPINP